MEVDIQNIKIELIQWLTTPDDKYEKIRTHILPYADILAWCLMPNHFHLMILVNEIAIKTNSSKRTINQSVGIMLCSYNKQ